MGNPNDEASNKPITGYRELSEGEVALINEIKEHAEKTRLLMERVASSEALNDINVTEYGRWAAIARTHLQQGFMAWVRAIAQPKTF